MAMRQIENDQAEDIGSGVHAHLILKLYEEETEQGRCETYRVVALRNQALGMEEGV